MLTDPALTVLAAGPQLLNPDYLAGLGLLVVLAVVLVETGLLVGFFCRATRCCSLPGCW